MSFVRVYVRVLGLLGPEVRLAWVLAIANLLLALAQFAEPVLFGRIVDALTAALPGTQDGDIMAAWSALIPLIGAWVGFAIFTIITGALIALFADRLAHRRRNMVPTGYFEHVLQLPQSYHGGVHSGRLL